MSSEINFCKNCKFYRRRWGLTDIMNMLFDEEQSHHRCIRGRSSVVTDLITGKTKTNVDSVSCIGQRSDVYSCSEEGRYWQPNNSWLRNKKNLFKAIQLSDKEVKDEN